MNLSVKDEAAWARLDVRIPTDILLAFDQPASIHEVIFQGEYRFRITEDLTRAEFLRRNRAIRDSQDSIAATSIVKNSRIDTDQAVDVDGEPDESFRYFYAAELV